MTPITKAGVAMAAFCSFASPLQAAEGILMVERTVTGTTTRTSQVQLERERMRAEMTGASGEKQIVIFDGPQQVLRIINADRKTYMEMTKADADRVGAQLSTAIAGMKEKMAKMPPEQRAKMEAAMSRLDGIGAAPAKPEYRRAGSDKVGKWSCDKYEGFRDGEKVSEVCTVEPEVLGLTVADFAIGQHVAAFFQNMLPHAEEQIVGIGTVDTQGFPGIPVRRIRYAAGKVQRTSEVLDVTPQTFAASTYDVPAGFTKQAIALKLRARP
jgi:hypothetical protein